MFWIFWLVAKYQIIQKHPTTSISHTPTEINPPLLRQVIITKFLFKHLV